MERILPIFCIAVLIGIAFAFSENKKKVDWKLVGAGVVIQVIFAFLILKTGPGKAVFEFLSGIVTALLNYT
ncbi:MAG: NupC/NupG family nucleoside CNT transporter, partial [Candidatus Riflebacteria bacterium]|nr:NupC/NupG family nucleoside CNT transporter [Candidatus Riflebacteria bacterium]